MKVDSERHHRRSIRLRDYDYTQSGVYFVTICAHHQACLFGNVVEDEVILSPAGTQIEQTWKKLPEHYPRLELDAFVIMPNHVQGLLVLHDWATGSVGVELSSAAIPCHSLSEIIRGFKAFSTREINAMRGTIGKAVWQRNYYEHIVRNEQAFNDIRLYIVTNPMRWEVDEENPQRRQ